MQNAEKHTFINAKNLQGSKFFRTFKYFLAQHSTAQHSHNKIFPTKKKRITKKNHRPQTIPRQQDLTYFNPNLEKQYLQHCATFATAGIIYKFPVQGGAVSLNKQLLYLSSLPNNNFAIRCTFVLTRLLRALVCRPPPIL